ncbi:MAG: twin-arginine translocation signal domain-containing protein [bacterium]
MPKLDRRNFLRGAGALGVGGALGLGSTPFKAQAADEDRTRFLIVLAAAGGASIIDSVMAIRASESANPTTINTFPDALVQSVNGSPLRAVDLDRDSLGAIPFSFQSVQSDFVRKHYNDMMVVPTQRTSVNHAIGQRRSVTGNEIWAGRTLQELVANEFGADFAIPNAHLSSGSGFTDRGTDASLPAHVFGEPITDPLLWPLALDSSKGLSRPFDAGRLAKARALRGKLEQRSKFNQVLGEADKLKFWQHLRQEPREAVEARDLINKLLLMPQSTKFPLSEYGLAGSDAAQKARERFPLWEEDPLEAQAALAYLLLRYRVSVSVTLGPSFSVELRDGKSINDEGALLNPPIAFDFSHQGHRSVQALMWQRMYRVADGLIDLLKSEEYANGESFWDRSMIYIATDFGRTKTRPANSDEFSTGHDLNNGVLLISPLVNGNKVLGGVDPNTGLTYGFNPSTGEPDVGRTMEESEVFAGILQALGVDTSPARLPDMRAMRKA